MAVPRALRILGLFSLDRPVLSIPMLMASLRASRATVYRDVRALVEVGLLERVDARGYALGTRIVELDRQIRLADPLVQATGDLTEDDLRVHLAERLVRYKIPRSFEFVAESLRDDAGKARRTALRDAAAARLARGA